MSSKGHNFEDNEKMAPGLGHIPEAQWPDQKHVLYKFMMHLDTQMIYPRHEQEVSFKVT